MKMIGKGGGRQEIEVKKKREKNYREKSHQNNKRTILAPISNAVNVKKKKIAKQIRKMLFMKN